MGRLGPRYGLDATLYEIPMIQGWALYAHAIQSDGWMQFGGVKRKSRGYVGQEVDRLVAIAKQAYGWKD